MLTGTTWELARRSEVPPALAAQFRGSLALQPRLVHAVAEQLCLRPEHVQVRLLRAGDQREVLGKDVVRRAACAGAA
eukprot:6934306-Pyramimonas_sp.AAC.1